MDTKITLECGECHSRVQRPVHISQNGHMYVKAQKLVCACCRQGEMEAVEVNKPVCADNIKKFLELTSKPMDPIADNWFTEEPDMQVILEDQGVLHMAKPRCQVHRSGDLYHKLLEVIIHEGLIRYPDGRIFAIEEVGK